MTMQNIDKILKIMNVVFLIFPLLIALQFLEIIQYSEDEMLLYVCLSAVPSILFMFRIAYKRSS
jgi:hypothetical protein